MANLARHVRNVRSFGVPAVVAINHFASDTAAEHELVRELCRGAGVDAITCRHWAEGGAGTEALAEHVVALCESARHLDGRGFRLLYPDDMPLWDKLQTIAQQIYGAEEIIADKRIRAQFAELQEQGYGHYPVCVAKTQYSFSTDPNLKGAPSHHVVPVREVRLANGAEFVVAICGDIMTMPGLPRVPAANTIRIDAGGPGRGPVLGRAEVTASAPRCSADRRAGAPARPRGTPRRCSGHARRSQRTSGRRAPARARSSGPRPRASSRRRSRQPAMASKRPAAGSSAIAPPCSTKVATMIHWLTGVAPHRRTSHHVMPAATRPDAMS